MSNYRVFSSPMINHKYKIAYFPIFKTGCLSTTAILEGFYHFNKISLKEFKENYSDYYKFTFFRNIYKRFNSAVKYLTNHYKDNKNIQFTIDDALTDKITDYSKNHLKPQTIYYDIDYDFIGDTDNLHFDLCRILIERGFQILDKHLEYIKLDNNMNNTSSDKNISFSQEVLDKINEVYKNDFEKGKYQIIDNIDNNIDLTKPTNKYNEICLLVKDKIISIENTEFKRLNYFFCN